MNINPKKLKKGDTVALLAPASYCEEDRLPQAIKAIESYGLRPKVMASCYARHGYFAGSDSLRANDIMAAFADSSVHGIFALRGGYGAQRLLPLLDYELIAKNPKIFCGYSDITALHTVFNQQCGFVSYHAPMPGTEPDLDTYTRDSFLGQIMEEVVSPVTRYTAVIPGKVSAELTGGNLSLLVSSIGTPYEIDSKNRILFIEEIQEEPYRVDRMLLQLKQAGKLNDCQAILLGSFFPETLENLSQAIDEIIMPLAKPLGVDLPCGHCLPTATLPLGAVVCMDNGLLSL